MKNQNVLRMLIFAGVALACLGSQMRLEAQDATGGTDVARVLLLKGSAEYLLVGAQRWLAVDTNTVFTPGDQIRVLPNSQLALRFADQSIVRIRERSELVIQAPKNKATPGFAARLVTGILYFFHRDKPADVEVETRLASAAIRGTEFNLEVSDDGTTILTVLEGAVELRNALGTIGLSSGEQGVVTGGNPPVRRAAIDALNVIQWTLYYPGVLDPEELSAGLRGQEELRASLEAYRAGDLTAALREYPADRRNAAAEERVYEAALLLGVGDVDGAEQLISNVESPQSSALRTLISAVTLQPASRAETGPTTSSGWLAESYRRQSVANLPGALEAARNAVERSTNFGFALARVAELEFSFGRIREASRAVKAALEVSPRNAQAIALNGFLLAARNKRATAQAEFQRAIEVDPLLANAWLGRGLVRIRGGDARGGREDLLAAAALEPQRAFLRSYLGKAWTDAGDRAHAERELEIAKRLDPRDPTAWLYSALLKEQYNQINEAVRDLEHSQDLNENRAILRSRFALEQDRAVRSANLARIYREAGMEEWSVLTAGRAVSADYANYSAHLFLANSYALQIDPASRRYETPAVAEYFIANLLAPVGAGILSPTVSAHEYSYLFEKNRLGFVSETEYLSRGAWAASAAQFGTFDSVAYSLEGQYTTDPGQRPNADAEQRYASFQLKPKLTEQDTVFLRADFYRLENGDLAPRYEPQAHNPSLRSKQEQTPNVFLGYHREWSPEAHTLLLAGRVELDRKFSDSMRAGLLIPVSEGNIEAVQEFAMEEQSRNRLELYTIEPQQIWQTERQTTIIGVRLQTAKFKSEFVHMNPSYPADSVFLPAPTPMAEGIFEYDFQRVSGYGYHQLYLWPSFQAVAGIAYDYVRFPVNFRVPPLLEGEGNREQLSPKLGFVWNVWTNGYMRGAYTRSLAGATIDQSYQIEPTQVAGLNQSYRSIIPEALGGSLTAARFATYALSLEQRLPTGTFFAVMGSRLDSKAGRVVGTYELPPYLDELKVFVANLAQQLEYTEETLGVTVNQLIGGGFSAGASYRISRASFDATFPRIGPTVPVFTSALEPDTIDQAVQSTLQHTRLLWSYNERHGWFAGGDANWFHQSNRDYQPELAGDDFWQFNVYAGYRLPRRNAEIVVGLLNLTHQNYKLSPVNLMAELPRARTIVVQTRLSF